MSCNCGCNSGCGCDPNPCHKPCTTTSTTSTTTIPCIGEQCDELYDCECVRYRGKDLLCYGIKDGTTLCEIIRIINDEVCKLQPSTGGGGGGVVQLDCRFGTLTATILTTTTTIFSTTTIAPITSTTTLLSTTTTIAPITTTTTNNIITTTTTNNIIGGDCVCSFIQNITSVTQPTPATLCSQNGIIPAPPSSVGAGQGIFIILTLQQIAALDPAVWNWGTCG